MCWNEKSRPVIETPRLNYNHVFWGGLDDWIREEAESRLMTQNEPCHLTFFMVSIADLCRSSRSKMCFQYRHWSIVSVQYNCVSKERWSHFPSMGYSGGKWALFFIKTFYNILRKWLFLNEYWSRGHLIFSLYEMLRLTGQRQHHTEPNIGIPVPWRLRFKLNLFLRSFSEN